MRQVLEKGGFAMVADSDLEEAVASRDLGGINLLPPPPEAVEYEIFYRYGGSAASVRGSLARLPLGPASG